LGRTALSKPSQPPSAENGYQLDTQFRIWHLIGSERLPAMLRDVIVQVRSPHKLWLSPISIWELGKLVERGRLQRSEPLREWVASAHRAMPLEEAAITSEVALRSNGLDLPHPDPADHLLAATALVYGLTMHSAQAHQGLADARGAVFDG
jgi:PIN domain nuclease of toxin-antitoxin system